MTRAGRKTPRPWCNYVKDTLTHQQQAGSGAAYSIRVLRGRPLDVPFLPNVSKNQQIPPTAYASVAAAWMYGDLEAIGCQQAERAIYRATIGAHKRGLKAACNDGTLS